MMISRTQFRSRLLGLQTSLGLRYRSATLGVWGLLALSPFASAAPPTVVYEGFNYSSGSISGQNGGTGWTGAWAKTYAPGGVIFINSTGFSYTGLTTVGGKTEYSSSGSTGGNQISQCERSTPLFNSGIVYLQFLSQLESGSSGGGTPQVRLEKDGTATGLFGGNGGTYAAKMSILDMATGQPKTDGSSSTSANLNALNLTILRFNYNTSVTEMWVNPNLATFDYYSPPTANVTYSGLAPEFNSINLMTRNPGYFDELRVMQINGNPPTDIALTNTSIDENNATSATIGTLSSTDVDGGSFTYSLVTGTGDTDNASFTISGTSLLLTPSANYEAKSSYAVRIQTTDSTSNTYSEAFTITINNLPETPTNITLTATSVAENVAGNTTVGTLGTTDSDSGDTFTYALVAGTGDTDNAAFNLSGTALRISASPDYETKSSYAIRVQTTDSTSRTFEKQFTITITNVNEGPAISDVTDQTINEDSATSALAITVSDLDTAVGSLTLTGGSSNTALVPVSNIVFGGSGANRTVVVTPVGDGTGSATITVTVSDGSITANDTFLLTVTAVNDAPSFSSGDSNLVYETVSPTRVSSNIVYSVNNAAALASTPFTRVRYRMQLDVSSVTRYADASFDKWTGLTVAGLKVPDASNPLTIHRNVNNLTVASNYAGVTNASLQNGRLEIWPSNYATGTSGLFTPAGNAGNFDYDDTGYNTGIGHGSFQVHNMSGTPQTVLAWNNHGAANPEIGFGNGNSTHPDWTFNTSLGKVNWKLQIYIGTEGLPSTFTVTEDAESNLLMGGTPFVDPDAATLTVTLAIPDGAITGNAGTGVTVGGSATSRTFTGTVADLNTYFTTAGKVTYLGVTNNITARTLTITSDDGVAAPTVATATVNFTPVNDAPTDIALSASTIAENNAANATVGTLSASDVDTSDTFTYTLVSGTGSTDNASFTISGNSLRLTPVANFETKSSYAIRLRTTDNGTGSLTYEEAFTISVTDVNETPTNVNLSAATLVENVPANTTVGALSTTDVDAGDTFTYTLVSGTGSTDNAAFNISGSSLRITNSPDYETQTSYAVRVRSTDAGGLLFERQFTITITNVDEAPTDISLSATTLAENAGANATVGTLSTTAPAASTFTYTLVSGTGSTDNASFNISGTSLRLTASADYETLSSYAIRLRTTDANSLYFEEQFTITITNVNETPSNLTLSAAIVTEGAAANSTVGTFSTTDVDVGDTFTYTLVSGTGSTDNTSFNILGGALRISSPPVLATQSSYAVRVRTTDAGGLSFENQFTITVIAPEISVEVEAVAIASGGSKNFHAVPLGTSTSRVFTIRNTGSANLNDLAVSITGTHAADYAVTSGPDASISGPAGVTTFTVEFTPSVFGIRTAALQIANNDHDENPFNITLVGGGGDPGAALDFDGENDEVQITAHADFNTPTFTVEGWVKPSNGMPQWARLWGTANNQGDLIVKTGTENRFSFAPMINGSFAYVYAPTTWTAGVWYHIAGVVDHTMIRLFVNGVQVASRPYTGTWAGDSGMRYIGRSISPKKFKGVIDDVRYWNYARNCDQIFQARTAELSGAEPGLVAYYPFNEGLASGENTAETTATDVTGHGHHGSLAHVGLTNGSSTSNWVTPGAVVTGSTPVTPEFEEITLKGNGVVIHDGDTTPSATDHTDFGDTSALVTRTFTLENNGNLDLVVSSVAVSDAAFTLGGFASGTLLPGATADFTVSVPLTSDEVRRATVTIASNDCDEGTYDFAIQSIPAIAVAMTATSIAVTDATDAGGTLEMLEASAGNVKFSSSLRAFSVNGGALQYGETAALDLSGITAISVTGSDGDNTLDIGAFPLTTLPGLTINGGAGDDTLNFIGDLTLAANASLTVNLDAAGTDSVNVAANANITTSGSGGITMRASKNVSVAAGASVTTVNGNLTVEANQQGTPSTGSFVGINVAGGVIQATGSGAVTIKGKGGNSTAGTQIGVRVLAGGDILSASGLITVEGTGGGGATGTVNYGVQVTGTGSSIASSDGNVSITGIEGTGTSALAIVGQAAASFSTTADGGSVTMIGNTQHYDFTSSLSAPGSVNLRPRSAGRAISLGGADSATQLGLTDAELDRVSTAVLNIGSSDSGAITQVTAITRTDSTIIHLTSNAQISARGSIGTGFAPGDTEGDVGGGTLSFGGSGDLAFAINGSMANTGYTQLNVAGAVNLSGANLVLSGTYVPLKGQSFTLINNDGADAVVGTFTGLPEGTLVPVNGVDLAISYLGGSGNDVTLSYAAPVLTVVKTAITAAEGSTAANSGTVSDQQGNITSLVASLGTATDLGGGAWSWSYVPPDGPVAPATVTVTATDSSGESAAVTFSLTVTNAAPVAQAQTVNITEEAAATPITLVALEPGVDDLTYSIVTAPLASKGVLSSVTGNSVSFTPAANFAGVATFIFKATDSDGAVSKTALVTINVAGINDAPSFVKGVNRSHPADFATAQAVAKWAMAITDGDAEVIQTLTFNVSQTGGTAGMFDTVPAISSGGTLTYKTNGTPGTATFNVTLQDNGLATGDNVNTSGVQSFSITVLDDSTKPTVTITTPLAAAKVPENTVDNTVTVTGTAKDNKALQKVQVQINGGGYVDATTTIAPGGLTATYTTTVTPQPGLNTLTVRSYDALNNVSTVVTRSFTYVVMRTLDLTITPANSGTVTYTPALVAGKAQLGTTYVLKATAAAGFFFDHWTAPGVTSPAADAASLSIVMSEGLAVTATFEESPFTAGTYSGLATPADGTTPSQYNLGTFTGSLTTAGSFSGKVNFGGTLTAFTATFDRNTGDAAGDNGATGSLAWNLHLDLEDDTDKITGTVSRRTSGVVTDVCDVDADRATFSTSNKVPDQFLKAGDNTKSGTYTVVLPALPNQLGGQTELYPQGDGIGTLTVSTIGTVTLTGTLADGTVFTSSSPLSKTYQWPLAVIIKSTATVTGMTLGGWVQFDTLEADSDVSAASLMWFRPAKTGADYYPAGWPEGIETFLTGAKFAPQVGSAALPGLSATNSSGNATLELIDGLLTNPITKSLNIATNSVVTKIPTTDTSYTLTVGAATGAVSGSFAHPGHATLKPLIKAVILQKGANRGGYGFFLSPVPTGSLTSGESGAVSLGAAE